ncbi:hypothetical protein HanRHA438_Chr17g0792911 [Helianthus annuus]|nr:hypothetical protein HanRHA438_Chr17g0792911 [Helianthus annuus]
MKNLSVITLFILLLVCMAKGSISVTKETKEVTTQKSDDIIHDQKYCCYDNVGPECYGSEKDCKKNCKSECEGLLG